MSTEDIIDVVLAEEEAPASSFKEAAAFFEQAAQAVGPDPEVLYLQALAWKRQGQTKSARAAFLKIAQPDADVWLQLGLLSLLEGQLSQAEEEFSQARQQDKSSFPACYNLLLTRLSRGRLEDCQALFPCALELVPSLEDRRILLGLQALLRLKVEETGTGTSCDPILMELTPEEEEHLVHLLQGLGNLELTSTLLGQWQQIHTQSPLLRVALVETVLVKAKHLVDRGDWLAAQPLLSPWVEARDLPRVHQAALMNLLGCCCCLSQDPENGVRFFSQALKQSPNDPSLYQNLALAYEQQGQLEQAEPQWNRWFDLLGTGANGPQPPGNEDYHAGLVFEGLLRLASRFSERECWNQALGYVQRAQRLRPRDPDTLERLFRLYVHLGRPEDARRILYQLREIQPEDGHYDHYELELVSVRTLNEVEQVLEDLDQARQRHPESPRVKERLANVVGTVLLPFLRKRFEGLSEELKDVVNEVNDLPDYQINWSAVANEVRDLRRHFLRLRRLGKLCLARGASSENERRLQDLIGLINRKLGVCRSIME